jgi:hypothetical protein
MWHPVRFCERSRDRRIRARRIISSSVYITHEDKIDVAQCCDISGAGARLSIRESLTLNEIIAVTFGPALTLKCRVAWVCEPECGIEFLEHIESLNVMVASNRRRSAAGVVVPDACGFREGLPVTIIMPLGERRAIIRWTNDEYASLEIRD